MATLNVMYELTQSNGNGVVELILLGFHDIDLGKDQQADQKIFKNEKPYVIITPDRTLDVKILAKSTDTFYGWKMKIWLVDATGKIIKTLTPTPISVKVDKYGRADYNMPVLWKDDKTMA